MNVIYPITRLLEILFVASMMLHMEIEKLRFRKIQIIINCMWILYLLIINISHGLHMQEIKIWMIFTLKLLQPTNLNLTLSSLKKIIDLNKLLRLLKYSKSIEKFLHNLPLCMIFSHF